MDPIAISAILAVFSTGAIKAPRNQGATPYSPRRLQWLDDAQPGKSAGKLMAVTTDQ
jgi:hypothetical protein